MTITSIQTRQPTLTNQRRADVSSLMINFLNGIISSNAIDRRFSAEVIFLNIAKEVIHNTKPTR